MPIRFGEYYQFDEDYKPELYLNPLNVELNEADKREFMTRTDEGRIKRAKTEIRTQPPRVIDSPTEGYERLEYNFKAFPSTEFKRHWGYADVRGTDVHELFCDCKDFFYRLYAPMVKAGLATWDLPSKYKGRVIGTHNKEWTKDTNPDGTLFVCKHLYALLGEYVNEKEPPDAIIEKNKQKYQRQNMEKQKEKENNLKKQQQDKELRDLKTQQKRDKFKSAGTHVGVDDQAMDVEINQDINQDEEE